MRGETRFLFVADECFNTWKCHGNTLPTSSGTSVGTGAGMMTVRVLVAVDLEISVVVEIAVVVLIVDEMEVFVVGLLRLGRRFGG